MERQTGDSRHNEVASRNHDEFEDAYNEFRAEVAAGLEVPLDELEVRMEQESCSTPPGALSREIGRRARQVDANLVVDPSAEKETD